MSSRGRMAAVCDGVGWTSPTVRVGDGDGDITRIMYLLWPDGNHEIGASDPDETTDREMQLQTVDTKDNPEFRPKSTGELIRSLGYL